MAEQQTIEQYRTEICGTIIGPPSAWLPSDIGPKEKFARRLTPEHLAAIDELLAATRHLAPQEVTRAQFDHPALNGFLRSAFDEIMHRHGFVVITGIMPERYSEEEFERIYWGFGTHWGHAVVQSPRGDRLGHVRYEPPGPHYAPRAYTSAGELVAHCDAHELVGLMCVKRARTGGASGLVSSLAAHSELLRTRPDLLDVLYNGYQFTTREALRRGQELTPYAVPIFSYVENTLSCYYNRAYIYAAEKYLGPVSAKTKEAMDWLNAYFADEKHVLTFMLERGEMAIWHNFTILHARTHFEDDDDPNFKRHLLRMWLHVPNGRPMIPVYHRDLVDGA
jgi:Taurine catabolism dioxygenase TauD, TfdA family